MENFQSTFDPLTVRAALLSNRSRAASWILQCLQAEQHELWDGLLERDASFLKDLWKVVSLPAIRTTSGTVRSVFQWVESSYPGSRLRELSPNGWAAHSWTKAEKRLAELLPEVDTEWTLEVRRS